MFKRIKYYRNSFRYCLKCILFLKAFLFFTVDGIVLDSSFENCDCILAKNCEPYTKQLLESSIEERKLVARQMQNAFCGRTFMGEPKVYCPSQTASVQTRFNAYSSNDALSWSAPKDNQIWIWERRLPPNPFKDNDELSQNSEEHNTQYHSPHYHNPQYHKHQYNNLKYHRFQDYDPEYYDVQHQYNGHKYRHVKNRFDDYKDEKTALNCPNVFYEETDEPFVLPQAFEQKVKSAIVYPNDKRLRRPRGRTKILRNPSGKSNNQAPDTAKVATTAPQGINSPKCGLIDKNNENFDRALVNDVNASEVQRFPWITRIAYRNKTSNRIGYRCTGSFISDSYILTAAHCVTNLVNDLQISHVLLADRGNLMSNCSAKGTNSTDVLPCPSRLSPNLEIANIIVHPNYDRPKRANDVALIQIRRTANTPDFGTICLPLGSIGNENQLINSTGVVAGWSNSEGNNSDKNVRVKYLRLPIVSTAECANIYERFSENYVEPIRITSTMLCAQGQSTKEVCQGDSGGPFMDDGSTGIFGARGRYTLIGIVAFGPSCGGRAQLLPGVYMRVSEYFSWIMNNVN